MRLIAAFFRMVRLPNLLFIVLTQVLFQYYIYLPLYKDAVPAGDTVSFVLLVIASVCIAAAGYIINDYFDINIDEINKPEKMVLDKTISRRWAIAWHMLLSVAGVVLTALAVPLLQKGYLVFINACCVALLWYYSTTLKKKVLIGNFVIALLTAWTILVIFFSKVPLFGAFESIHPEQFKLFRFAFLYAGFAFITTLVREAIKDVEDMRGDARYGCKTMPLVWGVGITKVYISFWILILIIVLLIIQAYVLQFGWLHAVIYTVIFIILPLVWLQARLYKASGTVAFHQLSSFTKWIILAGIISMVFFYFYL